MRSALGVIALLVGHFTGISAGQAWASGAPPEPGLRDNYSDTWVAVDALGRRVPTAPEVALPRPHKAVGIFYFLWLGQHGDLGPFDISRILAEDPDALAKPASPLWGPMHAPHHWGESIFGYYVSDDEGVLRRHAHMLANAGVDVVIFDVTNQLTYPRSWRALCRVFDRARLEGNPVPQFAFLCPFGDPVKVVGELWNDLYQPGLYPELWFRWAGKPLILADPKPLRDAVQAGRGDERWFDFFTFRKPQPDYFRGPTGPDQWGWLEVFPQHVFTNSTGAAEQMTVGVAQNAVDGKLSVLSNPRAHGRSYHDGRQPGPEGQDQTGRNFAEQWGRALAVDPAFLFVTGWNEWIAGRFDETSPFYADGPVTFVDQFDREYSRDIEPMRGGHGDNYYYQLVGSVRRYKGARIVPPLVSRPIRVDGRFGDWAGVGPEFRDAVGDPMRRDHPGWGKGTRYTNYSGRNDLVRAKVSVDTRGVHFYVQTRAPLSPPTDPNWMLLYLDVDGNPTNGWLGYDFVVNRQPPVPGRAMVERHQGGGGGYAWGDAVPVESRWAGSELELGIPWKGLGLGGPPAYLDFKWADNISQTGDWSDFTLNGDVAPDERFNYRARIAGY